MASSSTPRGKCRQTYPGDKIVRCVFNSAHHVLEHEFDNHIKTCPDRATSDRLKYMPKGTEKNGQVEVENWDDMNEPTYNPQQYAINAPVLRNLIGATPSERKAFRAAETERLNNFQK